MFFRDLLQFHAGIHGVGVPQHEVVVPAVRDVLIDRDHADVRYADVDPDLGLAVPDEVRGLLGGGDVVRLVQLHRVPQVLHEHVGRRLHLQPCHKRIVTHREQGLLCT